MCLIFAVDGRVNGFLISSEATMRFYGFFFCHFSTHRIRYTHLILLSVHENVRWVRKMDIWKAYAQLNVRWVCQPCAGALDGHGGVLACKSAGQPFCIYAFGLTGPRASGYCPHVRIPDSWMNHDGWILTHSHQFVAHHRQHLEPVWSHWMAGNGASVRSLLPNCMCTVGGHHIQSHFSLCMHLETFCCLLCFHFKTTSISILSRHGAMRLYVCCVCLSQIEIIDRSIGGH